MGQAAGKAVHTKSECNGKLPSDAGILLTHRRQSTSNAIAAQQHTYVPESELPARCTDTERVSELTPQLRLRDCESE